MRKYLFFSLIFLALSNCGGKEKSSHPSASLHFDSYGGLENISLEKKGYFYLDHIGDFWFFVDPEGHPFYSIGVDCVSPNEPYYKDNIIPQYGGLATWTEEIENRLKNWGFNTIGSWSIVDYFRGKFPYTVVLSIAGANWQTGAMPDFYSQEFTDRVKNIVKTTVRKYKDDPYLLGFFLDNELHWGPDWRIPYMLFDEYIAMEKDSPGKIGVVNFLKSRYGTIEKFNQEWGTNFNEFQDLYNVTTLPHYTPGDQPGRDRSDFLKLLATIYFSTAYNAIKKEAPHALILGCRLVSASTPKEVVEVAGKYVDVMSVNFYDIADDWEYVLPEGLHMLSPREWLENFYAVGGRPVLISEFGYRALDAPPPGTWPPIYPRLPDQKSRADATRIYLENTYKRDFILGAHWFELLDQPPEGRFDGENSNFGLLNRYDDPYTEVIRVFQDFKKKIYLKYLKQLQNKIQ